MARRANEGEQGVVIRRGSLIALALIVLPLAAHAQGAGAAAVDEVLGDFQRATAGWFGALQGFARSTFGLLAMVQLAWAFGQLVITRADFDAFLSCLVREIMMLGLFWFLLEESTTFGPLLIGSFRQAASTASGVALIHPGDMLDAGINLAGRIMGEMSIFAPTASLGLLICALLVGATIALVCASMVVVIIESYFVIAAGILLMAFGGSQFTNSIAASVVRTVFAIGAKIFAMQLIASIGIQLITEWANRFQDVTPKGVLIEISMSLVLLVIVRSVPGMVERMAGGHGMGAHAGALFSTAGNATMAPVQVTRTATAAVKNTANAAGATGRTAASIVRVAGGGSWRPPSDNSNIGRRLSGQGRRD
jgi:type IV secretion system protein TrbL